MKLDTEPATPFYVALYKIVSYDKSCESDIEYFVCREGKCPSSIRHGIADFLTPQLTLESIPLD
jgi:hypothetical protein